MTSKPMKEQDLKLGKKYYIISGNQFITGTLLRLNKGWFSTKALFSYGVNVIGSDGKIQYTDSRVESIPLNKIIKPV